MKHRQVVTTFFLTSIVFVTFFFGVLFFYDPLKLFHKPWIYKNYLQSNMRLQAAGIINNWQFDSIILGTSILENTSSTEASRELGGKFVNLSAPDMDFFERTIILEYALKKKVIKSVIYSLDYTGLVYQRKGNKEFSIEKFYYLYDNNPLNDFKAYLNDRYLECIFNFNSKNSCMGKIRSVDRPREWVQHPVVSARFGGLDNWLNSENNKKIRNQLKKVVKTGKFVKKKVRKNDPEIEKNFDNIESYLESTIIQYVKKFPGTNFILLIPPYSRVQNAINAQFDISVFKIVKENIRYLVRQSENYSNLEIYGWGDRSFPDKIEYYSDLAHFEYTINSWILKAIKRNDGILTQSNVEEYLSIFTNKSMNYNLVEISEKIEKHLNLPGSLENSSKRDL